MDELDVSEFIFVHTSVRVDVREISSDWVVVVFLFGFFFVSSPFSFWNFVYTSDSEEDELSDSSSFSVGFGSVGFVIVVGLGMFG